jgi:hypothetical protein
MYTKEKVARKTPIFRSTHQSRTQNYHKLFFLTTRQLYIADENKRNKSDSANIRHVGQNFT